MKSIRMLRPDVMKEDGWHQNIPFTEPANIQKHEIVLKKKSVRMIRPDVMSRTLTLTNHTRTLPLKPSHWRSPVQGFCHNKSI